jgi:hypothetical protein
MEPVTTPDPEAENKVYEQPPKYLDYDVLLEEIGEFGWFQKVACGLLWVPAAVGGIHVLMYAFTGQHSPPAYPSAVLSHGTARRPLLSADIRFVI